jgi:hypothetical protein
VSKRSSFSPSKAAKAALGHHGFIGHTLELLRSEAWRGRSIHAMRLLDCIEVEHLAHAGKENGHLAQTYAQFVAYGIPRQYIKAALEENAARGLLRVTHKGGYSGGARNDPSTYQLTYLAWKFVPAIGPPQYLEPTNEWKNFTGTTRPTRKPRPFTGIKPNGHDPSSPYAEQKMTRLTRQRAM